MGLFSKTRTSVYSTAFPLVEFDPNATSNAVVNAILTGSSISSTLQTKALNSTVNRMKRFRKYAKEQYIYGLPDCAVGTTGVVASSVLEEAILAEIDAPYGIVIDVGYISPLYVHHILAPFLLGTRQTAPITGIVGNPPEDWEISIPIATEGHEVQCQVYITDLSLDDQTGNVTITYSPKITDNWYVTDPEHDDNLTFYRLVIEELGTQTYTENITTSPDFHPGMFYCIANYRIIDSEGVIDGTSHWWYYELSSGKYPDINIVNTIEEANNLFPIIPVRYENCDQTREDLWETDNYKTSKKLLKILDIDFDQLGSSLNENPDIAEIDYAYVMFGVNLQTDSDVCNNYLFEFFDYLSDRTTINYYNHINQQLAPEAYTPSSNIFSSLFRPTETPTVTTVNTDWYGPEVTEGVVSSTLVKNMDPVSFEESGLNITVDFSYIRSDVIVGSIGKVGTVKRFTEFVNLPRYSPFSSYTVDKSMLTITKQITDTLCKRIIVAGLTHRNYIYGDRAVTTTLSDIIEDPENNNFILPLHYGVSTLLSRTDREVLYTEAMVMVMNSVVHTHLSWYETGFFKMLFSFVAWGIACFTGQAYLMGLSSTATASVTALMVAVLPDVLMALALSVALTYVVELIGPKLGALLAVVAVALGGYKGFFGTKFALLSYKITAQQLVGFANGLLSAVNNVYEAMIGDLSAESDQFLIDSEDKLEKLQKAQELLEMPDLSLDLLNTQAVRNYDAFTGTPSEYYDLRIHTGNIGTLALDVPKYYHTLALTLPETSV